jgi:hypothetical protein
MAGQRAPLVPYAESLEQPLEAFFVVVVVVVVVVVGLFRASSPGAVALSESGSQSGLKGQVSGERAEDTESRLKERSNR